MTDEHFLIVLGSWADTGVGVNDILENLERLRQHDARAATRTSVVTLVVTASSRDEANRALEIVDQMGARHPARTLGLGVEPGAEEGHSRLDAEIRLQGSLAGGHPVWSDTIVLTAYGPLSQHLDSIVEPLALPDLPIAVWYLATAPSSDDPVLHVADIVVVDTKELGARWALAGVADVSQLYTVLDLSWVRLQIWRELMAGLFEGDVLRPYVSNISTVEVRGKPAPRRLLSGWLSSRLNLTSDHLRTEDDQHVTIVINAQARSSTACFEVRRVPDQRLVEAVVSIDGSTYHREVLPLPDHSPSWALAEGLMHLEPDRVWERALQAGIALETA